MHRVLPVLLGLSLTGTAMAADEPLFEPMEPQFAQDDGSDEATDSGYSLEPRRGYFMEVGFRSRYVTVPDSILDIWYYNENDDGWALPNEDRPDIQGYALSLIHI